MECPIICYHRTFFSVGTSMTIDENTTFLKKYDTPLPDIMTDIETDVWSTSDDNSFEDCEENLSDELDEDDDINFDIDVSIIAL